MIQTILAYIIILIATIHMLYGLYKLFFTKTKNTFCPGCNKDNCRLKQQKMFPSKNN